MGVFDVSEQEIQKSIIQYLELKKYVVFKHHSTGFTIRDGKSVAFKYGKKGISDIIACSKQGVFIAIEVKKPGGKATPEQLEFIASVRANKGIAFVAYSVGDVIKEIETPPQSGRGNGNVQGCLQNAQSEKPKTNDSCVPRPAPKTRS